jgi:hypothetical protein
MEMWGRWCQFDGCHNPFETSADLIRQDSEEISVAVQEALVYPRAQPRRLRRLIADQHVRVRGRKSPGPDTRARMSTTSGSNGCHFGAPAKPSTSASVRRILA